MYRIGLLILVLLLPACATTQPPGATQPWQDHLQQMLALQQWQASGKLALRSGSEADSANLLWQQSGPRSDLQLSGPLGMSATRIVTEGQYLEIQRGEEFQVLDITTPEAVQRSTGWDLPLASLPYWMRGIPDPGQDSGSLEIEDELLRSLRQDGWQVRFSSYGEFGAHTLPTRLEVSRNDTRVRLMIRDWQTESPR